MRHHHGKHCGCGSQKIVYPTKHCCVNQYSESVVEHIHPTHTTVVNHHLVKNQHVYPNTTSYETVVNSVNQNLGSYNAGTVAGAATGNGNGQVAGAMQGYGPGQVAGAMQGYGPGQVAGAMQGYGKGQVAGAMQGPHGHGWNKPHKWC